jgi:hypothetical protein
MGLPFRRVDKNEAAATPPLFFGRVIFPSADHLSHLSLGRYAKLQQNLAQAFPRHWM